jgi:hypothetical protein
VQADPKSKALPSGALTVTTAVRLALAGDGEALDLEELRLRTGRLVTMGYHKR